MQLTENDIVKIIQKIRVNYDNAYTGFLPEEMKALISFWYESLKMYPLELVNEAVKKAIISSEFAPRLANIMSEIRKIQTAGAPSDQQLWAELMGVLDKVYQISRYLPYPHYSQWTNRELNKIYDGLSGELKLFVVNRSTLVDISEMTDENLQYERARFFKQMPALRQHYYDSLEAKDFLLLTNNGEELKKIENKKRK